MKWFLLYFSLFISYIGHSQLNAPSSIVYYPTDDYYFVSNNTSGTIYKYYENGKLILFDWNVTARIPKGLFVVGKSLYVADGERLLIYNILTAKVEDYVTFSSIGGNSLTGICHSDNGRFFYLTNAQKNKIYIYDEVFSVISAHTIEGELKNPTGVVFRNGYLYGVSFIPDSPIWKINLADMTLSNVKLTNLDYLYGIKFDEKGKVYITAWNDTSKTESGAIYSINDDFTGDFELVMDGLSGPADFCIRNNKIFIPEMMANKITVINLNSVEENKTLKILNNGFIEFPRDIIPPFSLEVYNINGNIVLKNTTEQEQIQIDLPYGIYFLNVNNQKFTPILISR